MFRNLLLFALFIIGVYSLEHFKTDQNDSCELWASSGECDKNPRYMLKHCALSCSKVSGKGPAPLPQAQGTFYGLADTDINGNMVSFERFRNKVVFVVNVASYCGYTAENYELFRSLRKYVPWGLEIVIFPSNQFGQQEPGSPEDIVKFVNQQQFDGLIMSKGDVNGANARPAYTFLKQYKGNRDIGWNFEGKFLIDRAGKVIVPGQNVEAEIKTLLEQNEL
jgi:glutathione peroxidase-family protein